MDGGEHIVDQIVTRDETCVYYYDAQSNQEAKVWALEDEEPKKVVNWELHAKKIMYALFFRSTGRVKAIKLKEKQTITAIWCKDERLPQVFDAIEIRGRSHILEGAFSSR